jgi:zinc transport system substrate-binding protein
MQKRYEKDFSSCQKDTIIVNHNAFSYLAQKYNFNIKSINGLSNDSMPSPEDIKHILHEIEDKNISTIFFESFASDKLVKSIAKDTDIKVDTLQPLGNITKDEQGMSYEQIMDENIKKIKQALECR